MSDDIWKRDEIESPCVKICVLERESGLCVGCLRSGDEIARWAAMQPDERARIMVDLPARKGRLAKRRGGQKGRRTRGLDSP